MGVLNYETDAVSGEKAFIDYMIANSKLTGGVVMDVGANVGDYSTMLRQNNVRIPIFSFEPHPVTFSKLITQSEKYAFNPVNKGMGQKAESLMIYDYQSNDGSEHASIFKDVIETIHHSQARGTEIELTTVDSFVEENGISKIALLKIDTEGNEYNVLKGASQTIEKGIIDTIQIEFNEMNVVSRTFMKDIVDLLPGYTFYRLLPDGLRPMGAYYVFTYEIFAFQNIVAMRN
ncbi:FkbM family methyltransferase [Dyadobacter beijingensis]|nr:FkbM family methyltransferase [Dyadobacter beijingensis]